MKKIDVIILAMLLMVGISCKKPKVATVVPTLSYLSYDHLYDINNKDTTGLLKIYFVDGDGDVGMNQDEAGVDFYSVLYHKANGVWKRDSLNYNYRLPYLVGQGGSGAMKGEILITFNKIIVTSFPMPYPDSVKFQCYIVDRAGNESNKVFTSPIEIR